MAIQNQSKPSTPTGGASRSTHINVVKGRKMSPSSGKMNVSNTASTYAGRAIQMIRNKSRGANAPMSASKQPILFPSPETLAGDYSPFPSALLIGRPAQPPGVRRLPSPSVVARAGRPFGSTFCQNETRLQRCEPTQPDEEALPARPKVPVAGAAVRDHGSETPAASDQAGDGPTAGGCRPAPSLATGIRRCCVGAGV